MKLKKLLTAALSVLMLAGCGGNKEVTYDTNVYKDYCELGQDITTLNYLYTWAAVDIRVAVNFVDGLVENDQYGNIIPCLAESWKPNSDYTKWTFKLREGVHWYTKAGEEYAEVTADDFVYGIEYILNPDNVSYNYSFGFLFDGGKEYWDAKSAGQDADFSTVGVKAIDKYTIEYTMDKGTPYFLSALLYNAFYPANRAFVEALPDTDTTLGTASFGSTPDKLLYCGAYIMDEYTPDSFKSYIRNENYWDKANVPFEKVEVYGVKDKESVREYFERGETSYTPLTTIQVEALLREDNEYLIQLPLEPSNFQLFLNNEISYSADAKTAMNNLNFRKALYHAMDQDMFNELNVPAGVEKVRANGYIAPDFMYTPSGKDYATLGKLGELKTYIYDQEKAESYRDAAKAELSAQGVQFPIELKYWYISGNEVRANEARILEEIFEVNLGSDFVDVTLHEYATSAQMTEERKQGNVGFVRGAFAPDYADPSNLLASVRTDGNFNNISMETGNSHWNYPEFDRMFDAADAEVVDIEKRYEMFAEAEAYLYENAYYIPVYTSGASFQMTSINIYSKPYAKSGACGYKIKFYEAYDHAITTEEMAKFEEEWKAERKAQGIG